MGFLRYTIALAFVGVLVFYLAMAGELAEQEQYAVIGVMLVLGFSFIFSGQPTFDMPAVSYRHLTLPTTPYV